MSLQLVKKKLHESVMIQPKVDSMPVFSRPMLLVRNDSKTQMIGGYKSGLHLDIGTVVKHYMHWQQLLIYNWLQQQFRNMKI